MFRCFMYEWCAAGVVPQFESCDIHKGACVAAIGDCSSGAEQWHRYSSVPVRNLGGKFSRLLQCALQAQFLESCSISHTIASTTGTRRDGRGHRTRGQSIFLQRVQRSHCRLIVAMVQTHHRCQFINVHCTWLSDGHTEDSLRRAVTASGAADAS